MHSILKSGLKSGAVVAALALAAPAWAQTAAAPDMKTFASSAEVAALEAKAKAEIKPGQAMLSQPLLALAPYKANLEYRPVGGDAVAHMKDAELIYVVDGAGTFVVGGQLTNPKPGGANIIGDGITGGETHKVVKGDMLFVPQNTPHQVLAVDGALVLMTLHVPRP